MRATHLSGWQHLVPPAVTGLLAGNPRSSALCGEAGSVQLAAR